MSQATKKYNPLQELNTISKLDQFHVNQKSYELSFPEIKRELKVLMKELNDYKTNMRLV